MCMKRGPRRGHGKWGPGRGRGSKRLPGKRRAVEHLFGELVREAHHWSSHMLPMLVAAVRRRTFALSGKDRFLADWLRRVVDLGEDLDLAAEPFQDLDDLARRLPHDLCCAVGRLHPALALKFQDLTEVEQALEVVFDRRTRRLFPLATRGVGWGAFADRALYYAASPRYLVLPCFHTHPSPYNELGYEMSSVADYRCMEGLHKQLGGIWVCDRVFFPSGRQTLYGVDAQGRWFYCRQGQRVGYISRRE